MERVYYGRTVEMSEEDFAKYRKAVARKEDDYWFAAFAERYIVQSDDITERKGFEHVGVTVLATWPPNAPK